jgi:regulator of sirC expression with transglutaminase-like and TPR domain
MWIEVGRRAGLEVAGVGMPMHFLVGVEGSDVYADPFHGGRVLSTEDAMMLFAQLTDGRLEWQDTYLAPTPPREIVRRALTNLKAGYGASGDAERLLGTIEFLLAVPGAPEAERIDLARVLRALGRYHDAIAELRTYLEVEPEDPAGAEDEIRSLMAAMN